MLMVAVAITRSGSGSGWVVSGGCVWVGAGAVVSTGSSMAWLMVGEVWDGVVLTISMQSQITPPVAAIITRIRIIRSAITPEPRRFGFRDIENPPLVRNPINNERFGRFFRR